MIGKIVWEESGREKVIKEAYILENPDYFVVTAMNTGDEFIIGKKSMIKIVPVDKEQTMLARELAQYLIDNDDEDLLNVKKGCDCGNKKEFMVYFNAIINVEAKEGKINWSAFLKDGSYSPQVVEVQCVPCGENIYGI